MFLVLEGSRLPPTDSTSFPRGAGFYTTALKTEFHVLRDRWSVYHTRLAVTEDNTQTSLIGGFVFTGQNTFYIDEVPMTVGV